jgi:hypothetical protein
VSTAQHDGGNDGQPGEARAGAGAFAPWPGAAAVVVGAGVAGAEIRGEASAATDLEPCHLAVGHQSTGHQGTTPRVGGGHTSDLAHQRPQRGPSTAELPGEQRHHELTEGQQRKLQQHQRQSSGAGEGDDGVDAMPLAQGVVGEVGTAFGQSLEMAGAGRRHHHHPRPAEVGAPAQVDVVAVELDRRVEPAERSEQVGAYQEARRRQREHVANRVVLLLVGLTGLDERIDLTEAVDAESDVLQHDRVVPIHQLRADDAGVRAVQLFHHQPDGVGFERDVVVQEAEEPIVALDEAQHLVGRRAEPGVSLDGPYE